MAGCRVFLTSARKMRVLCRIATPEFRRGVLTHGESKRGLNFVASATSEFIRR